MVPKFIDERYAVVEGKDGLCRYPGWFVSEVKSEFRGSSERRLTTTFPTNH